MSEVQKPSTSSEATPAGVAGPVLPQRVSGMPGSPAAAAGVQVPGTGQALVGSTGTAPIHDPRIDEYQQVGSQFRALTDIRFKLIGFLPVGTIATVVVANSSQLVSEQAVATFGLLVTLCLATYNKRNDQLYNAIVSRAAQLERELGLVHGSFSQRPTPWLSFGPWKVEHGWPVGFIYAASAAVWTYVLVHAATPDLFVPWRGIKFGPVWPWVGAACVLVVWQILRAWEKWQGDVLEAVVVKLKEPFSTKTTAELVKLLADDSRVRSLFRRPDKAAKKIKQRLTIQEQALKAAQKPGRDYAALSLILSNVVDLPARWIHDVWTGRR